MAFNLKNIIFSLYPPMDKRKDVNKDANGYGTMERFNRMVADDFDIEILPYLGTILENTLIPETALQKFFIHIEDSLGVGSISDDFDIRRRFLMNLIPYLKIKGTKKSYISMFQILGFDSATITEQFINYSFDSPTTFDDIDRTFDMSCYGCSWYSIDLIGTLPTPLTVSQVNSILFIIKFNEPIDTKLKLLTYNSGDLVNINLTINPNGGFPICTNPYDPELKVELILGVHTVTKSNGLGTYTLTAPNTLNYKI